jgi:hypothetical protein
VPRSRATGLTVLLYSEFDKDVRGDLVLTDPLGQRIGYDPRTGAHGPEMLKDRASYERFAVGPSGEHCELTYSDPEPGEYHLQIVGSGKDVCRLLFATHDCWRRPREYVISHLRVRRRAVIEYRIVYDGDEAVIHRVAGR